MVFLTERGLLIRYKGYSAIPSKKVAKILLPKLAMPEHLFFTRPCTPTVFQNAQHTEVTFTEPAQCRRTTFSNSTEKNVS